MSELVVPIITGLITAVTTIIVCCINNYVVLKKDRKTREAEFIKSNEKAIAGIQADFTAHMEEIIATQSDMLNQINIIQLNHQNLCKAVEKHNNVIERTYKLENRMDLAEERQKTANHRIDDLEDETKELRVSKHE